MKFEEYLQEVHAKEYIGSKDKALDDFDLWVQELEIDDWLLYGDMFACEKAIKKIEELGKKLRKEIK